MKSYDINVTRDGRWWMVEVPDFDGLTQARRLTEVAEMAREWIALETDVDIAQVEIGVVHVRLRKGDRDLAEVRDQLTRLKQQAEEAEAAVSALMRDTAATLTAAEVPVRDIGEVLGVSHQRVSQLVNN
jgi:predicted RNase H-like HicB family nuclease